MVAATPNYAPRKAGLGRIAVDDEPTVEVDDAIVLLLGGPSRTAESRNRIEGITRLEKLIFLFEHESDLGKLLSEDPEFRSHNFGPFSSKIYQAADTLVAAGLITDTASIAATTEDAWEVENVIGERVSDPYSTRNLALTEKGERYYRALIEELPDDVEPELQQFKDRFASIPLRQLIRYVYQRYPKFTDKSLIRDEVLG